MFYPTKLTFQSSTKQKKTSLWFSCFNHLWFWNLKIWNPIKVGLCFLKKAQFISAQPGPARPILSPIQSWNPSIQFLLLLFSVLRGFEGSKKLILFFTFKSRGSFLLSFLVLIHNVLYFFVFNFWFVLFSFVVHYFNFWVSFFTVISCFLDTLLGFYWFWLRFHLGFFFFG